MLSQLVNDVGAERILFGTDYPVCNPGVYVGGVLAEKITDSAKELIFSGNAKRLLGI
jgi:predicted TIM-barrel fold metal-dependent hydrolase